MFGPLLVMIMGIGIPPNLSDGIWLWRYHRNGIMSTESDFNFIFAQSLEHSDDKDQQRILWKLPIPEKVKIVWRNLLHHPHLHHDHLTSDGASWHLISWNFVQQWPWIKHLFFNFLSLLECGFNVRKNLALVKWEEWWYVWWSQCYEDYDCNCMLADL